MNTPYHVSGSATPAPTAPGASVPSSAYGQAHPAPTSPHERSATTGSPAQSHRPATGEGDETQGGAPAGFAALLQFGLLAAIVVSVWRFSPELGHSTVESIERCEAAGGDLSCVTSAEVWRYALLPMASVIAAFSLFRGAMAGNARRAGGGMVLTLLGFAVLAAAMAYGLG